MPNHKDASKRLKQNDLRRARNKHFRTKMRNQIKQLRQLIDDGNVEEAQAGLKSTVSVIQRVAQKGVIHRNQAARRIARLNKAVKNLATNA